MRPHIAAVYAFARIADDFADEGSLGVDERLARLDDWKARLHEATAGRVRSDDPDAADVFTALAETMRTCDLDVALFDDLLSAFRQDVTVRRYETWADLLDYCRRSANPVGRLVLRIAGYRDPALDSSSDALCTALQLTNFWQDVAIDWDKGRVYVPQELVRDAGADEQDLAARRLSPAWRHALQLAADGTRRLFDDGRVVVDGVNGRLKWELRATWLGGVRILQQLQASGYDVFRQRPSLEWTDAALIGWRALRWR
jgi:squalene synthase HpnC